MLNDRQIPKHIGLVKYINSSKVRSPEWLQVTQNEIQK